MTVPICSVGTSVLSNKMAEPWVCSQQFANNFTVELTVRYTYSFEQNI